VPSVELPDADEQMELVTTSEMVTPFGDSAIEEQVTLRLDGSGQGRVALVADDDPEVMSLVAAALRKLGCVVLQATNGRQALDLVREARPDVVFLDAMMPGMHGFEVCRTIKADRNLARIPVILCSAIYRGTVAADAQIAFGADAFVEKPFRLDELTRIAKVALLGAGAEGPAEKQARAEAERAWRAAAQALSAGRDAEAAKLAGAAAQKDPRSAEAHYYLGHALARQKHLYEAVAAYERAAELRPDVYAAHQCLAQVYEDLGFRKSAREAWARAIESCKEPARKKAMQARLLALLEL
jgi:CheY-like chemotaxis protein